CTTRAGVVALDARPTTVVRATPLGIAEHRAMWSAVLPEHAGAAASLAARLPVDPAVARAAVRDARALAGVDGGVPHPTAVGSHVRARIGAALPIGVHLVHPQVGWADLVLAPDKLAQLRSAVARVEHQGTVLGDWGFLAGRTGAAGVRLLFAGPSGTGKTLSAEVLAGALGVDLLLVDLSRIVSKWIGETEKQLAAVFDAAEATRSVLFFDEADSLFGQRTEVRDASDRYANLETAFLLSRLERYEGVAVLATNLRDHVDRAFARRLEVVVEFGEPDEADRLELWRCHLPDAAPLDPDVDLTVLAHLYEVVGGVIRNAAVSAGFAAAADGGPIRQHHLIHAIHDEYRKAGRPFPGAPFRPSGERSEDPSCPPTC
ncbi:MAG TPA: ATP-binding protein, partial [Acidimicrobiales bacterium]|nr:ATP-binding protein [Acidimicrobiales bacterium]